MSARGLAMALALGASACATASLTGPSPYDAGPPACSADPQVACDAAAPSAQTCTGDPAASGPAGRLPTDASYPIGCGAYFSLPDCSNGPSCACEPDDAGVARWRCRE